MYRCEPCDINYTSTRKLFSHQLSAEHIKRQQFLKSNYAHSIRRQFSNHPIGRVGVGRASDGLEIGREIASTGVSVNQSSPTTRKDNTYGMETAGPSTSMNINRASRPQQHPTGPGGRSNTINQPNESLLADGVKGAMRKNTCASGVRGGKFVGRRASVVHSNRHRNAGARIINQPTAPTGPQLGTLRHRRGSTISRKPAQKVLRTVRQRNERARSVQRKIEPGDHGTVPQGSNRAARTQQQRYLPNVTDRGTSAAMNRKVTTKTINKQQKKQSVNPTKISLSQAYKEVSTSVASASNFSVSPPCNPIKLHKKRVEMNMNHIQTEKVEQQQQEKSCRVREHLLAPPKTSVHLVAHTREEGGGSEGGRAPPKKNTERYNRCISIPLSPLKIEGVVPYQLFGDAVVPSTSSAKSMGTNTKSAAAVGSVSGTGRRGDVVTTAAASSCKARESTFKATPQNKNLNPANGLNPIQHSGKSREGAGSFTDQPSKSVPEVVAPTTSSANRSNQKSNTGSAASGRMASNSSTAPVHFKAKVVPGKALCQKKNGKSANTFKTFQPSREKGKGTQSSLKGKSTKPHLGIAVSSKSSDTANLSNKKKNSAALGGVVTKVATAPKPSQVREVGRKAPAQKKNRKRVPVQIQACSKKHKRVPSAHNVKSTKRPLEGEDENKIVPWLSANGRGSEVVVKQSTTTATAPKRIARPKISKTRKRVRKVTLKQLKNYVPTMPGTDYKMPLSSAMGTYTDKEGKTLWICLVCSKTEPMKSSKPMVCCDICEDWYHFKCVGIKKKMPKNDPWYCKRCIYRPSEKKKKHLKNA